MVELAPVLVKCRAWADEHHEMAPEVLDAAREAGAFLLNAPAEHGGWEATLPDLIAALEEISGADPTVAWHAGNSMGIPAASAHLDEEAREEIFGGPAGPFGFSAANKGVGRPTDGGYLVTGTWPMVTGALHVTWGGLYGMVHDGESPSMVDGVPDVRMFIIPADEFTVDRTWDVAPTMRGTGSHQVSMVDVFVPEAFAHSWARPVLLDRPLYRIPSMHSAVVTNAATALGLLRGAYEHARNLVENKVSSVDGTALRDKARYARQVAETDSVVRGVRAALHAMGEDVWAEAQDGRLSRPMRGHMSSTAFWAFDTCRRALSELAIVSTSGVYTTTNPTESAIRDLHAINAAMEPFRDFQEAAGRVLLHQPPGVPGF